MNGTERNIVRGALAKMKRDLHRLGEKVAALDELVRRWQNGES